MSGLNSVLEKRIQGKERWGRERKGGRKGPGYFFMTSHQETPTLSTAEEVSLSNPHPCPPSGMAMCFSARLTQETSPLICGLCLPLAHSPIPGSSWGEGACS